MVRIGTAGWTIPGKHAALAQSEGSHLERYASMFGSVEINSSFHRSHRLATWARWAETTPESFRFSVKLPKKITHVAKLAVSAASLDPFFQEVAELGNKLAVILVQLPPSLSIEDCPAAEFFNELRNRSAADIVLEPRNATWFTDAADELLECQRIARVAADPPRHSSLGPEGMPRPGGWEGLAYFRLHGTPRVYYSSYDEKYLAALAGSVRRSPHPIDHWVIFDNTAMGHAFENAIELQEMCRGARAEARPKRRLRDPL